MEKREIRPLLDGPMAKSSLSLLQVLQSEVKGLYATFGKHHTMAGDAIAADVNFISKRLNEAIKMDSKYSSLRVEEIPYLFRQGVQGSFGEKFKSVSLALVYSWFSDYLNSSERRGALSEWVAQHSADLPDSNGLHAGKKLTEDEMWEWVERNYNSYCRQLQLKVQATAPTMLKNSDVPWAGRDVSGLLTIFLVKQGYMKEGEKFYQFCDRTIANEGIFQKVA